ncbi:methionine aminopeptidase 1D, mitochondrial-like [Planococcus citri]|uniref:methionine aminopeptidase 1D, mitochondrial-like n=1 Tax=Planococcus citri TaxID=170843 RepID=UPI0031F9C65E
MLGSESTYKAFIVICVIFISCLTQDIVKANSDELIDPPYPVLHKIIDESLPHTSISDENSTTKQMTRITQTRITVTRKTTFAKVTIPYRCHRTLQTGSVGPAEIVPSHIPRPAYVLNNGTELAPKFPLIKNDSLVEAINQSCSISKSVLEKLESYVREGITTEQIDTYAHELITRRGAYPSYLQFHRYPKSITTSINNIVAFGKPDNTKLRSGDIITVDIPVYYNGYHGACVETFLVEKVDFAGQKLVNAAREITYAAINCSRPGESFLTLGRVIERETKLRGYQVIPSVQGYGIGEFLREYPRIIHFGIPNRENIKVKNEAINGIMQPGMVFTVRPAITDGKPDCVSLPEESYEYQDKWTVVTMDGSRSAQFGRTVLITNDGYKILS